MTSLPGDRVNVSGLTVTNIVLSQFRALLGLKELYRLTLEVFGDV
jgi:hypothetical protein